MYHPSNEYSDDYDNEFWDLNDLDDDDIKELYPNGIDNPPKEEIFMRYPTRVEVQGISNIALCLYGKGFTIDEIDSHYRINNILFEEGLKFDNSPQAKREIERSFERLKVFKPEAVNHRYNAWKSNNVSHIERTGYFCEQDTGVANHFEKGSMSIKTFFETQIRDLLLKAAEEHPTSPFNFLEIVRTQEQLHNSIAKVVKEDPEQYTNTIENIVKLDVSTGVQAAADVASVVLQKPVVLKHPYSEPDVRVVTNIASGKEYSRMRTASTFLKTISPKLCVYDIADHSRVHLFNGIKTATEHLDNVLLFQEAGKVGDAHTNVNMWQKVGLLSDHDKVVPSTSVEYYDLYTDDISPYALKINSREPFTVNGKVCIPSRLSRMCSPEDLIESTALSLINLDVVKGLSNPKSKYGSKLCKAYGFFLIDPLSHLCVAVPNTLLQKLAGSTERFLHLFGNADNFSWKGYLIVRPSNAVLYFQACNYAVVATYPYLMALIKSLSTNMSGLDAYMQALRHGADNASKHSVRRVFNFLLNRRNNDQFEVITGRVSIKDPTWVSWVKLQGIDFVAPIEIDENDFTSDVNAIFDILIDGDFGDPGDPDIRRGTDPSLGTQMSSVIKVEEKRPPDERPGEGSGGQKVDTSPHSGSQFPDMDT